MFENFPLFPESASSVASRVDAHFFFLIGLSVFFSILIAALVLYFAVKYRKSKHERPEQIEGSLALEITWTVIPLMLALTIFFWGASIYFSILRPPAASLDIYVVGKQWMWKFQHPTGQREINELHIPVGRTIKLTMATEDVIHSLFVPAFRMKYDVVPGHYRIISFTPTKPGKYHLFCAEYCGTKHAGMGGFVYVLEAEEYQNWLGGELAGLSLASAGEKLFQNLGCVSCHVDAPTARGPVLTGLMGKEVQLQTGESVIVNEDYLRESIFNPQAKIVMGYQPIMPTYQGLVSEENMMQILAYLKSLSPPESQDQKALAAEPDSDEANLRQP